MIEVTNLDFRYTATTPVFQSFTWHAQAYEPWAIIGPSGCGKSTLLYLLAGLKKPNSGQIVVHGEKIDRPRPQTGLILQDYGLLPWRTIRQNVELGLGIRRFYGPDGKHAPQDYAPGEETERAAYWLDRLGIAAQADKYPGQVSGGQRQRAAIARTLVLEPDLLLMDEPFSSLDALTREALQDVVIELHRETGLTLVIVTHNIEEAVYIGRKILVLNEPPTRVPQVIDNPLAFTPGYRTSMAFLEQANAIRQLLGLVV